MKERTMRVMLDPEQISALDAIAEAAGRDRSFVINDAVACYLELHWNEEREIQRRLEFALAGDVASGEEVSDAFAKWKR